MYANNCKPHEIKIIDPMTLSVKSARRKDKQCFENFKISKEGQSPT